LEVLVLILVLANVGTCVVVVWGLRRFDRRFSQLERRLVQDTEPQSGTSSTVAQVEPRLTRLLAFARRAELDLHRLRRLRLTPVLLGALVLNALVAALWLWSLPGYTTHVMFQVVGNHYRAVLDGQEMVDADLLGPTSGGMALRMAGPDSLPTGAGQPAVRSIVVTDLHTGAHLLEDHFTGDSTQLLDRQWPGGSVPKSGGILRTPAEPWTDYQVDVELLNPIAATLFVRYSDDRTNAQLSFRPWRDLDSSMTVLLDGAQVGNAPSGGVRADPWQTSRGVLAVALRRYPWVVVGSAFLGGLFLILARLLRASAEPREGTRLRRQWPFLVGAIALAVAATCGLAYSQADYLQRVPHVVDAAILLFQAKMFAAGMIAPPAPAVPVAFEDGWGYLVAHRDLWISQYPFGHPLLLAVGQRLGQAWLVEPVVGGASVLLVFWIGRCIYGPLTGLVAALLLVTSPFFQMSNVDYMSHGSGAFYLLCAVLGLVYLIEGKSPRARAAGGAISGVALGLLFNTRPLTGFVVVLVVGAVLGLRLVIEHGRWRPELLAFVGAGLALLLAYFGYNAHLMGNPLDTPYILSGQPDNLGLGGRLSPQVAFSDLYLDTTLLDMVLFGWPAGVALCVVLLPFILGSSNRWDYLLGTLSLGVVVAYFFWYTDAIMYGPRYWYEIAPLLVLLAARGLALTVGRTQQLARALGPLQRSNELVVVLTAIAIGTLVARSALTWWAPPGPGHQSIFGVPQNVRELQGFDNADARFVQAVAANGVHHAVVLVPDNCANCYVTVLAQNDPLLQGDVIFARDRPATYEQLRAQYPDRAFYQATNTQPVLLTRMPARAGRRDLASAAIMP
jgi:4-amino-4-deoxy-L-arabinose transferase-like glycosyltransferase